MTVALSSRCSRTTSLPSVMTWRMAILPRTGTWTANAGWSVGGSPKSLSSSDKTRNPRPGAGGFFLMRGCATRFIFAFGPRRPWGPAPKPPGYFRPEETGRVFHCSENTPAGGVLILPEVEYRLLGVALPLAPRRRPEGNDETGWAPQARLVNRPCRAVRRVRPAPPAGGVPAAGRSAGGIRCGRRYGRRCRSARTRGHWSDPCHRHRPTRRRA